MSLPADIDFTADTRASPARMNVAMTHLDARLRALELPAKQFDQLLAQLQQVGLQRINDALQPYYQALTAIVSLGVLFNAASTTLVPVELGRATLVLSPADRDRFAPAGWLQVVSQADTSDAMIGRMASYDRTSGTLAVDVVIASGSGSHADWMIMPAVPPMVPMAVIDAGSDAGNTVAAVPYVQLGPADSLASVLASLPTSPAGLPAGSPWLDGGTLAVVQP